MAGEVELDRLVVRLMGDGSDYSQMMDSASDRATQFSGVVSRGSGEVANGTRAMGQFDLISSSTGRTLSMTGRMVSRLGMGISALSPEVGGAIARFGMFGSMLGQVIRTASRFSNIMPEVGKSMSNLPQMDLSGMTTGAGEAGVGLTETADVAQITSGMLEVTQAMMATDHVAAAAAANLAVEQTAVAAASAERAIAQAAASAAVLTSVVAETELASVSAAVNVSTDSLTASTFRSIPAWEVYTASVSQATGALTAEMMAARAATLANAGSIAQMAGASTTVALTAAQAETAAAAGTASTGLGISLAGVGIAAAAIAIPVGAMLLWIRKTGQATREAAQAAKNYQEALKSGKTAADSDPLGSQYARENRNLEEQTSFAKSQYKKQQDNLVNAKQAQEELTKKHAKETQELNQGSFTGDVFKGGWNLIYNWETRASSLASQQSQDEIEVKSALAKALVDVGTARRESIDALNQETAAMYAAVMAGKVYLDSKDLEASSAERHAKFAKKVISEAESARAALRANPIRPGHELEDAYANERPLEDTGEGHKAAADKVQMDLRAADARNAEKAFEKAEKSQKIQDYMTLVDLSRRRERIGMMGVEAAKQEAIDKAIQENEKNKLDFEKGLDVLKPKIDVGAAGKAAEEGEKIRQETEYAAALEKTRIEQSYYAAELRSAAEPRNEELKSTIAAAQAYDMWRLSHDGLADEVKEKARADIFAAEAQKLNLKHVQEGAALHEKNMTAQEKFNLEQERLQKLLGKGGFTIQDYNKELMALWLQLHQEYSLDLKMGGAEAMIGNSNKARVASWNQQKMGDMARRGFDMNRMEPKVGGANPLDPNKQAAAQQAQVDSAKLLKEMVNIAREHWIGAPVVLGEG